MCSLIPRTILIDASEDDDDYGLERQVRYFMLLVMIIAGWRRKCAGNISIYMHLDPLPVCEPWHKSFFAYAALKTLQHQRRLWQT